MTEVARTIPLSKLVPSEANVRHTNADAGLGELAASIKVHGILQNLIVRPVKKGNGKQTGTFEVVAGGRRYAALNLLVQEEHISKNYPVPCNVRDDDNPVEISLAENVVRAPIHPADQFEAFAKLHQQGLGASEIAGRFGVSPLLVEQRLKLAGVSRKLMEVYREGGMTLEQLMAFTITDDHDVQARVWFESPLHDREPHSIRRALTRAMVHGTDRRAQFIGAEAYEAAGGVIVRDLFHAKDEGYFADSVLLDTLVSDKLKSIAEEVEAEGWAWVEILPEMDYGYLARMGRVQPITVPLSEEDQARLSTLSERYDLLAEEHGEDPPAQIAEELDRLSEEIDVLSVQTITWAADDKDRAGVAIALDFTGTLRIERGLLKPEEKTKARQEEPALEVEGTNEGEPQAPTPTTETTVLSDALLEDLSAHRTAALRAVLASSSEVALTALLHTLVLRTFYTPLCETCVDLRMETIDLGRFASGITESKAMKSMAECHSAWRERLPVETELWTWLIDRELETKLSLLAYCTATAVNAVELRYGGIPEPIICEELWGQVNAILDERRVPRRKLGRTPVHLFAGFAHCACGHKMYVPSNTPKYVCYKCRNKIPVVDLEGIFHEQLKNFLVSPDEIASYLRQADERMAGKEKLLRSLDAEQKNNAREMERLYRLYMDDGISREGFSGKYRSLEERQKQIEEEVPSLQAELDLMKIHLLSSEEIITEAKDLYSRWSSFSREEKRHIIEQITERIVIGKDDIDIALNYLPSAAPLDADILATQLQGFMAATSWKRAG